MKITTSSPLVSVVSPAYCNGPQVAHFLASLRRRCRQKNYEVVVVDDGSPSQEVALACRGHVLVRCVSLGQNRGAAAARNAGARAARGSLILFVDSDAEVASDLVRWAREALVDPVYGAAIGRPHPRPRNPGLFSDFWALLKAECLPTDQEAGSFYPAIGVIRRGIFLGMGGFSEKFQGASVEDFEFSERLKARGIRTRYEPRMVVRFAYPGMGRNLRQSFSRAGKWMMLRWGKVSFDRHTTTFRQAATMLMGATLPMLYLSVALGWIPWLGAGIGTLVYLVMIWPFLDFCRRNKGWAYLPTAAALHALVALVVTAGVARATFWRLAGVGSPDEFLGTRDV